MAQKVVKIYQVKFENENVAGSHFIAEAHQICMLSKQSEWANREQQLQPENSKEREGEAVRKEREKEREDCRRGTKKASEQLQEVL